MWLLWMISFFRRKGDFSHHCNKVIEKAEKERKAEGSGLSTFTFSDWDGLRQGAA